MAKDGKQEARKTAWRGISVKTDIQPTSPVTNKSGRPSISWERQPLSPLSQPENNSGMKATNGTPKTEGEAQSHQEVTEQQPSTTTTSSTVAVSPTNSTAVLSTKSSSKSSSSKHRKEKLAGLGSLTKTPDIFSPSSSSATTKKKDSKSGRSLTLGSLTKSNDHNDKRAQKERERKERKEMEKLARKERKDQEKLEKERKEQQKKELKLAKEMERKERKSRTSSFLFSRSSKSSGPSLTTIDTASNSTTEDKPKSPVERRSLLSFGRHSLASLTSKPSNASTTEIVTPDPPLDVPEDTATNADSSSDEFVDFVDSQMSIHSDKSSRISTSIPQQKMTSTQSHDSHALVPPSPSQQAVPSSVDPQPQVSTSKLLDHLQQQTHLHSSPYSTNNGHNSSTSSITSSNSKNSHSTTPINTNHSMLYILNSLQDAGRNIEDDDLLDDQMANKMEKTQQQHRASKSYQTDNSQAQPRIQALEIIANQPAASTDSESQQRPTQQPGTHRLSVRTSYGPATSQQQLLSPSLTCRLPTSPTISHRSSISNSSYDTVSQADTLYSPLLHDSQQQRHSTGTSPSETTDKPGEEPAAVKTTPNSPIPGPITVETTKEAEQDGTSLSDHLISDDIESDKHSNTMDDDGSNADKGNCRQMVDLNEHQKESDNCSSSESKDMPDTSSQLPTDEINNQQQQQQQHHDGEATNYAGESLKLHAAEQNQSIETNISLPSTTKPATDIDNVVETHQLLVDDEGDDAHCDEINATGNDENKHDDATEAIQQIENDDCGGHHEATMKTIQQQQPVDDSSNGDDEVTSVTVDKDELLLAEELSETKPDSSNTQTDIIGHESTVSVTDGPMAISTSSSSPLMEPIDVPPVDIIKTQHVSTTATCTTTTTDEETKSSSLMEAAAAVTASKRSTFLSRRWSATPPTPSPLEHHQQRPTYAEPPTSTIAMDIKATIEPENGIAPNFLNPREQEEADQPIRQGMSYLFGNKFTKAMSLFKTKTESEPLHALGLGSMLFLKAMMTYNEDDINAAMDSLTHAYNIASIQADLSEEKRSFDDTFSLQFSSLIADATDSDGRSSVKTFKTNGVLRAHVIKGESCLLMGILQLAQENMTGYLKSGLNLKKACASYNLVWNEYQNMGDQASKWMDEDTVSGVQFGVGTLHLLLSCLPEKIVKVFSGLVWKTDRALGLTLLNSVMAGKSTRSSFGSLILLSYYSLLSSAVPSIYAQESIQPTIECLVAAQKSHPKSCFFLYFAARISRVARNVGLSTQSFTMATSSTRRGAWAEVAMKHTVAYEVGLNHAMQLDWDTSAAYFEQLCCARDWSPAFCQYFVGACHEMQGQRLEAIDIFDEVPVLSRQQHHRKSLLDNYVQNKVERHQYQNYRDLDNSLPGLEILLLLNAFASMEDTHLQRCLLIIQETYEPIKLDGIYGLDDDDDDQSGDGDDDGSGKHGNTSRIACYCTLLLLKSAVLNALSRYNECIADLEWVLEKKHLLENEGWLLPFVYYETGVTHWGIGNQQKSRDLWQQALSCTKHDFEFRMASRIHLAMAKCDQLGIMASSKSTTNGRKRF